MILFRTYFSFLLLLLFVPSAFGIGLAYPRDSLTVTYRPSSVVDVIYYAVAQNGENNALISVSGDFAQYATYDRIIKLSGPLTKFIVTFTFPPKHTPGVYETMITAVQTSDSGEGQFSYVVGASAPLQIRVLDPGKHMEMSGFHITPKHATLGENISFQVTGTNYGEKAIQSAKSHISISYNEKLIETLTSKEIGVPAEAGDSFSVLWPTIGKAIGEYYAEAKIMYDGKETLPKKDVFYIGNEEILLQNYTQRVTNDSVNKFSVVALSQWNTPLDFSAGLTFISNGVGVATFKTPTETLNPWVSKTIDGFVDLQGFPLGMYDLNITFFAGKKQVIHQGMVEVIEGKPHIIIQQIEKAIPSLVSPTVVLALVLFLVFLVVINVVLLVHYRKKR